MKLAAPSESSNMAPVFMDDVRADKISITRIRVWLGFAVQKPLRKEDASVCIMVTRNYPEVGR